MNQSDDISSRHRQTWELIPWVVNGRASPEERRIVEQHLADCGDCREEYRFQSQLRSAVASEPQREADPRAALQRLWRRIDGEAETPTMIRRVAAHGFARGLLAAVIVEAVGIAALSAALWTRDGSAGKAPVYQTLSAPADAASRATIRAVLAPTLNLGQVQALLAQAQLQIVGGPSEAGVYSLAPRSAHADSAAALARLRADPGVRFAEPVDARAAP
jgi:anti-sigma factor RsiW